MNHAYSNVWGEHSLINSGLYPAVLSEPNLHYDQHSNDKLTNSNTQVKKYNYYQQLLSNNNNEQISHLVDLIQSDLQYAR